MLADSVATALETAALAKQINVLANGILSHNKSSRKSFINLTHTIRKEKATEVIWIVIAMCLSPDEKNELQNLRDNDLDCLQFLKNKSSLHQNIKTFSETFEVIIEDTLDIDLSAIDNSSCYHMYDDTGSNRVYANEFMNFNIQNIFTKLASVMNKSCSNTNYTKIQKQIKKQIQRIRRNIYVNIS